MRVAEYLFEPALVVQCAAKKTHFRLQITVFKSTLHKQTQLANIERSGNVISSSRLHRFDGAFHSAKRCHQNHSSLGIFAVKFLKQVDTRNSRHPDIRNDEVGRLVPHDLQHLTSILSLAELILRRE